MAKNLSQSQTTVKDDLLFQINEMEILTRSLFDRLAKDLQSKNIDSGNETLDNIVENLIEKDETMKLLIGKAVRQIDKEKEVEEARSQLAETEQALLEVHNNLREAENVLAAALHQASKKLESANQAKTASMNCEELIKFAFRISSGNSVEAPANWAPGDPRRPYPQDIEMRCGILGQLSQQKNEETLKAPDVIEPNEFLNEEKEEQDMLMEAPLPESTTSSKNGSNGAAGIWQVPVSEDMVHLMTMPVSAMTTHKTTSVLQSDRSEANTQLNEVEYMSTSSESSSSGESM